MGHFIVTAVTGPEDMARVAAFAAAAAQAPVVKPVLRPLCVFRTRLSAVSRLASHYQKCIQDSNGNCAAALDAARDDVGYGEP